MSPESSNSPILSRRRGQSPVILIVCVALVVAAALIVVLGSPSRISTVGQAGTSTATSVDPSPTSAASPTPAATPTPGETLPAETSTPISMIPPLPPLPTSTPTATPMPLTADEEAAYHAKLLQIANLPVIKKTYTVTSTIVSTSTGETITVKKTVTVTSTVENGWPVTTAAYPDEGALLPENRIVAYYGNFYSTQMGILGEYPPAQVLQMLASTSAMWQAADPSTHVISALDYIAVAAQASAGSDGKYRLRMPENQVDQAISMANEINGIVFLDIQVGLSNVETEVPLLAKYLERPNVELSLDPEFAMHNGARPGTVIGTLDASDINFAAQYLASIVKAYDLPPKILVVHRFTQPMVTNYKEIAPLPEVQIVMDMDGFGPPSEKFTTYEDFIASEPVQFTGFKLFYKNDVLVPGSHLLTPQEILTLSPQPSYIQYQ